jgi:signal transduction histidine kinase/ligand-binding sensor domain-containing protein
LLVSRDGTLWIGTFAGLASWNGRELTQYAAIGKGFVTSLLEDRDGTVWAGAVDRDGSVWAGLYAERSLLCDIRAGQARCSAPEGGFGSFVWSLAEDHAGNLWVSADNGLWRWNPGTPRRYAMPGMRLGDLTTTADGQILAGIKGGGFRQVAGDQTVPYRFQRATKTDGWVADRSTKSNKLLRDRDGGLWIGTEGLGLIHVKDGQADTFARADGLSGNIACSLFEDREGNIWYGSEKGVDRFRKLPVTAVSTKQGLPDEVTQSVLATKDGSVWVATKDGLARWKDGRFILYKERDGLPNSHVHSQYEDTDGRLWVSTARGLAYFADGRFVAVDGEPGNEVYAITGDASGNLWLSSATGLLRVHKGQVVEQVPWSTFGRPRQAQVIIADGGGVWLSFWEDGGVFYFKGGKVEAAYTPAQGLAAGHVAGLRLDDQGAVWAATDKGGLSRIKDGRVTTLSLANGLPCDRIQWSTLDDNGSLWMYMGCGLARIGRDDLAAWIADPSHRVAPKLWDGADGVPVLMGGQASFNPPVTKGPDGRLWFVAGAELEWVAPDHLPFNAVPPPVHIETLVADQKSYAVAHGLRLPPLARDITIEFAALTLVDPKSTRFRYTLEGHDNDWQEAIDRRQATYTNLAPGNYRFRVKASNNSGMWNEEGAQLEFAILPAFYQTTWFRLAGVVLLIGLAWSGFQLGLRLRTRRLHRQFEATLEARVAERTRIARDLHDTLLQRFHGLLLQFQAALNLLPDRPRESRQVLTDAIDRVAEAITEGRDTVQGLRTSVLETNNLADSLRTLAEDLMNETGHAASAHVEVQGSPQALHPLVRDETFRIAGEALRNAFHHADAKLIKVEICYDARQLRVRVRDDGKGIGPEVLGTGGTEGHFGLRGMRERAELVGGKLSVRSVVGAGTEVDFSVPGERAYGRLSATRSWLNHK